MRRNFFDLKSRKLSRFLKRERIAVPGAWNVSNGGKKGQDVYVVSK